MPYLFAMFSAAGYGINDLCIHMGMKSGRASSSQALIINLLSGNLLLAIATTIVYFTTGFPQLNWQGMLFFAASGVTAPFLGRIFSISAIKRIGATRTTTLRVSDTFFTMLLAVVMLKNVIAPSSVLGAVILVIGVVALINETNKTPAVLKAGGTSSADSSIAESQDAALASSSMQENVRRILGIISAGTLFALTSSFFFALGGIFRQMAIEQVPSAILGTAVASLVALVTNGLATYCSGQLGNSWNISRREAFFFALGGVGNTMGMLMFFLALNAGGSVSMTAALKNTSPLFTLLLSWIFLRKAEHFSTKLIASIFLVIIGAFFIVI